MISIFGPAVLAFKLSATDVEAFSIKIPFVPFSSFFFLVCVGGGAFNNEIR